MKKVMSVFTFVHNLH